MFATRPLHMYNIETVEPRYSETLSNDKVVDTAKFFSPVRAKCKKENLDITKTSLYQAHFVGSSVLLLYQGSTVDLGRCNETGRMPPQ